MKNTIKDIAVHKAQKQEGLVNAYVETNPIIATIPMRPASHGFYNVYGKIADVGSMGEVDYDDELPVVGISFELGQTRLGKIGGKLPMPKDAAKEMGGYANYAADRVPAILAKGGNSNEARIYYNGFIEAAIRNGKALSAKGTTADKQYSMTFVTYDYNDTVGLFNPNSLSNGKLFVTNMLNGGYEHLINVEGKEVTGKMMEIYMEFGLQLANPNSVGAIVNIEPVENSEDPDKIDGLPTRMMIEDCIASVRGNAANTYIYCHPSLIGYLAIRYNLEQRTVTNETDGVRYAMTNWNGIPLVGSYNINRGNESVIAL